jgi:hypothetical protein
VVGAAAELVVAAAATRPSRHAFGLLGRELEVAARELVVRGLVDRDGERFVVVAAASPLVARRRRRRGVRR